MNDMDVSLGSKELAFANAVARRFFHDPQDAADAAQDALLAAHRHRGSYRGEAQLSTWLHRIVVTTALGHLRKRKRRPTLASLEDEGGLEVASPVRSPEAQVADAEAASEASALLTGLGEKYERVFRMRFVEERAEADVAEALGLTIATVKIRTHRARLAVRALLSARDVRGQAHDGAELGRADVDCVRAGA